MFNTVEDRVRATMGDLMLQLLVAQQRVADLEQQLAAATADTAEGRPNGKAPPKQPPQQQEGTKQ